MQGRWDNTTTTLTGTLADKALYSPWTQDVNGGGCWDCSSQMPYKKRKTINFSLKKTPSTMMNSIIDHYNQHGKDIWKIDKDRIYDHMLYKSRKCGQTEKMRQIINIQLAQGKDVRVIDADGYDITVSGTQRFHAQTIHPNLQCRLTTVKKDNVLTVEGLKKAKSTLKDLGYEADTLKLPSGNFDNLLIDVNGIEAWKDYSTLTQTGELTWNNDGYFSKPLLAESKRPCMNIKLKGRDETYYVAMNRAGDKHTLNFYKDSGYTVPAGETLVPNYQDIEEAPFDIMASANRSFALEAINEESKMMLQDDTRIEWNDWRVASRPKITIRLKGAKYQPTFDGDITYDDDEDEDDDYY